MYAIRSYYDEGVGDQVRRLAAHHPEVTHWRIELPGLTIYYRPEVGHGSTWWVGSASIPIIVLDRILDRLRAGEDGFREACDTVEAELEADLLERQCRATMREMAGEG